MRKMVLATVWFVAACGGAGSKSQSHGDTADEVVLDVRPDGGIELVEDLLATDSRPSSDLFETQDVRNGEMSIADGEVGDGLPQKPLQLPLRTQGRYVVDENGRRIRLVGVNWNGGHEEGFVPYGLDYHTPDAISKRLLELGFNSIRLTYSDELVSSNPLPDPATVAAWPEMAGKNALEVFDGVVKAAADAGILVILNNHMSDAGWCCNDDDGNGLWYNERFSEEAWIANWVALAQRYQDIPAVIGADLRNEPRQGAKWSATGETPDWPSAAERCAEAVLKIRPDWLIFVEGIKYAATLEGVKTRPIVLSVPNRIVYSAHEYSWFAANLMPTYDLYRQVIESVWAFLLKPPYEAPVWVSEFGTCNDCWGDSWAQKFVQLVQEEELDWSMWMIFGDPGGGWGLMSKETLQIHSPELAEALVKMGAVPKQQ